LNAPSSKLYYRVRSNDFDGKKSYSGIVVVKRDNTQRMLLTNNPVRSTIQLSTQSIPSSVYFYELLNSIGQMCKKGSFSCEGSTLVSIPVSDMKAGAYTLVVLKAGEKKEFKILIQ
jgi:hypothetical protein